MAKFKFEAGAEFDTLTKDELRPLLTDFMTELSSGVKFRRVISSQFNVITGQVIAAPPRIGPDPGFLWTVKSLLFAAPLGAVDTIVYYYNDVSPMNGLASSSESVTTGVPVRFSSNQVIIHPNSTIVAQFNAGALPGSTYLATIVASVIEVPLSHEGQLLL